jgi:replicative DNA helicase
MNWCDQKIDDLTKADESVMSVKNKRTRANRAPLPPHSVEAESSILGALLLNNHTWDVVAEILTANDFFGSEHKQIYMAIAALIEANKPADVTMVFEYLKNQGKADAGGSLIYLHSLTIHVPRMDIVRHHAEIVRDQSLLRKLLTATEEIGASALEPRGRPIQDIVDEAEIKLFNIREASRPSATQGLQPIDSLVVKLLDRVQEMSDNPDDVKGLSTGFYDFDRMTSGLQRGDLIILAACPSIGATTFAINIAMHVAVNQSLPVAMFSLGVSASTLTNRIVAAIGRIDLGHLSSGKFTDEEWPRLTEAIEKLRSSPLHISELAFLSVRELRANARRLSRQCEGLGLIVVDHLQLMRGGIEGNRSCQLNQICLEFKALGAELNCPVIVLCQLSTAVLEQRVDKRPMMIDLHESGFSSQHADSIVFLYRNDFYAREVSELSNLTEVIIAKQELGPTGTVKLRFNEKFATFENLLIELQ